METYKLTILDTKLVNIYEHNTLFTSDFNSNFFQYTNITFKKKLKSKDLYLKIK